MNHCLLAFPQSFRTSSRPAHQTDQLPLFLICIFLVSQSVFVLPKHTMMNPFISSQQAGATEPPEQHEIWAGASLPSWNSVSFAPLLGSFSDLPQHASLTDAGERGSHAFESRRASNMCVMGWRTVFLLRSSSPLSGFMWG